MFEQSILSGETASHKTRALAASFGVQSLVVAVAILIPLIFGDRLPPLQPWVAMNIPLRAQPEPDPVRSAAPPTSAPSILRAPPRVFNPASLDAQRRAPVGATILSDDGISSSVFTGSGSEAYRVGSALQGSALPTIVATPLSQPRPVAPIPNGPEKPHLVGGDVQAAKLIRKVIPEYPPLAKQARISGTVRLTGVIAKDGSIEQLQVISGNPLLAPAAIAAVKQWLYRPTILDGQAVEVIAPIDVIFTLSR